MRRNSLLVCGVLLSIAYSLCFVFSFVLCLLGVAYFVVGSSVEAIGDVLQQILNPFLSNGTEVMLGILGGLVVVFLFFRNASSKYTKYSFIEQSKYNKKRGLLVFNLVLFVIMLFGFIALLVYRITTHNSFDFIIDMFICIMIALHLIAITYAIVGLIKYPDTDYQKIIIEQSDEQSQPSTENSELVYTENVEMTSGSVDPIYTEGLDGESVVKIENEVEFDEKEQDKSSQKDLESDKTKKLIEAIGKLDQMRKNGELNAKEYTKLREKTIKRFTN